jgi:hypothetical protein
LLRKSALCGIVTILPFRPLTFHISPLKKKKERTGLGNFETQKKPKNSFSSVSTTEVALLLR